MKSLRKKVWVGRVAAISFAAALSAHAQGVLTVTPGRTLSTTAGTTTKVGYTGDNGAGTFATLALPSAVAYDKNGNLYIADTNNHAIRELLKASDTIVTVAGTGTPGFSGDGAAATAALLDTPTGIAVDASGNLYIADSHNNRIRKVSAGTISTVAGTGTAGFAGDGAAATAAQLNKPCGIAVDASGNLYIADTNNLRIRKVAGGTIFTIAGTGDQGFSGDDAAATAATIDSPIGIAVDASGDVFFADRHNQRVREIATSGTITTVAGSGAPAFGGAYSGDNASATAAQLASPTGVSTDANGTIYIADSNNQRVRQVSGGSITTVAGNGLQDPSALNSPRGVANEASGNLTVADTLNQRVQADTVPTLTFAATAVGSSSSSATQTVTVANTGTASITVSPAFTGPFSVATGGICTAAPITLAAGASCTQVLTFTPVAFGAASGSVTYSGAGVATQEILLTGTGSQGTSSLTLASNYAAPFVNTAVTFTATVAGASSATPATGTVSFYLRGSSTPFAANVPLTNGSAAAQYTFTIADFYSITAVYSGDTNYATSNATLTQLVGDFSFTISAASGASATQSVKPGDTAVYSLVVAPLNGPFTFPITLSAQGLPPGATATFSPSTITLGSNSVPFTLSIKTAPLEAMLHRTGGTTMATLTLGMVLIFPFSRRRRCSLRPLMMLFLGLGSLMALGAISGCGSGSGFFGQPQQTYNIEVIGTASGANGQTLQHVATVQLTLQ